MQFRKKLEKYFFGSHSVSAIEKLTSSNEMNWQNFKSQNFISDSRRKNWIREYLDFRNKFKILKPSGD